MAPSLKHHRAADRFVSELPVQMGCFHGLTRNISATGIYFETEAAQAPGARVHFTVEVHVGGQRLELDCDGEVLRVDRCRGGVGIAARLDRSFFSDASEIIRFKSSSRIRGP